MGGQRLGAQVLGKVQIRNAKEVLWQIVSVDRHGRAIIQLSKAGNQRPGELIAEGAASGWPAPGRPARTR